MEKQHTQRRIIMKGTIAEHFLKKQMKNNGTLMQGEHINDGFIYRFENGYVHSINGLPAIEGPGHVEYWEHGVPHREAEPAIISDNFSHREYWENGEFIKEDDI